MGKIDIFDAHEKDSAWTKLWLLTDRDAAGVHSHYTGLTFPERAELVAFFQDVLEDNRSLVVGDRLGIPDSTATERPTEDKGEPVDMAVALDIHDPRHYSFGENRLWISWAKDARSGAKRGQYKGAYPRGLVIHWTAGHRNGLDAGNELMRETGMLYLVGDKDGNLGQSDSLKFHGYHAGRSSHKYANGYVSDEYAGIEFQAAGMLTQRGGKFVPWFGGSIPENEVVFSEARGNIARGHYHVYTRPQMLLARKLVCWLYLNNPEEFSVERVVGHDTVSPGRKVDPGASLFDSGPVTITEFQKVCWNDIDRITEAHKVEA